MEIALSKQLATKRLIDRFWDNLAKVGKAKMTGTYFSARLQLLDGYWRKFEDGHFALLEFADVQKCDYMRADVYSETESAYVDHKARILEAIEELTTRPVSAVAAPTTTRPVQLPKISLPSFSGDQLAWEGFRDLFRSLVHDVPDLSPIQKLQYLTSSLSGPAAACIANCEMSENGYRVAWEELEHRYDNKRVLLSAHMRALLSCAPVGRAASADLNRLMSVVNQAVRSFKSLGRPVEHWDDWFVHILVDKIDSETRLAWEASLSNSSDFPPLNSILEFLQTRVRALDAASRQQDSSVPSSATSAAKPERRRNVTSMAVTTPVPTSSRRCHLCQGSHPFNYCGRFRAMTPSQRREQAKRRGVCFNCLKTGHGTAGCPSSFRCQQCQEMHHTLLHEAGDSSQRSSSSAADKPTASHSVSLSSEDSQPVLLTTAQVTLRGPGGRIASVRALLDSGSAASFLSERVAQLLELPRQRVRVPLTVLQGLPAGTASTSVGFTLCTPADDSWSLDLSGVLVLPRLTSLLPGTQACQTDWPHLKGLPLADPSFRTSAPVDVILGAEAYGRALRSGLIQGPRGSPIAQLTVFGWVLMGSASHHSGSVTSTRDVPVHHIRTTLEVDKDLQRFWELEEVSSRPVPTPEDNACEELFMSTHYREPSGRYVVRLPMKDRDARLGESRSSAVRMLLSQERRLGRDASLRQRYAEFLEDYAAKGHMIKASSLCRGGREPNYLPHHPVVKAGDPGGKLRVVFNASFRTASGLSLNDMLLPGPRLQSDLWVVISRWRLFRYVFTADIVQMFRQIRLHPDDWDWQRIVWRAEPADEVSDFRLTTVTYGTASAPYLALRTLLQLARDEGARFPLAAKVIELHSYVDDLLAGADSLNEALEVRRQLTEILLSGGFPLSKWAANEPTLCPGGDTSLRAFQEDDGLSTLGLLWSPVNDAFHLRAASTPPSMDACTKRTVLSDVARLFDPLGWAAPVLIFGKTFIQELWMAGLAWDEPLPSRMQASWVRFASTLSTINEVRVPRWVNFVPGSDSAELHGFCDASSRAYAAAVYLRCVGADGSAQVRLLVAKTKVAPVKTTSIPRLELCGAVLLARLLDAVSRELHLDAAPLFAWTDAEVVLAWLSSHPSKWKPFVANRVATVQELTPPSCWRHVPTSDNPADAATRGIPAAELNSLSIWWHGPLWLARDQQYWPAPRTSHLVEGFGDDELRPLPALAVCVQPPNEVLIRFSSLQRLLRTTAWCLRFAHNCRQRQAPRVGYISAEELESCRLRWLRLVQENDFPDELEALSKGRPLPAKSPLLRLRPIIGPDGFLRVGGRLQHSLLPYAEKHPLILAKRSHLSLLLVRDAHGATLHGGPQLTRSLLLRRYWILHAGSMVRSVLRQCVRCARFRAEAASQQMGQLPAARVRPSRPFETAGVDYAGPIQLRTTKGRGHRAYKGYICLFVCLVSKAVHIEVASDLTSASFLDAFRRFVARRGRCRRLVSDNGSNFRGADQELRALFRAASDFGQEVGAALANDGTEWSFIPPGAPHFGGLWEAGVKAVKYHLRRILGDHTLTYEEMTTLLCQIEACLNSRPLSPLSNDPADLSALTPGHLLVGEALVGVPEPSRQDIPTSHSLTRWAQVSRMRDHFWKRWSAEYIHHLQTLTKWRTKADNVAVGALVLLKEENLPPTKWALARVTALHPGADGLARVVTVKTAGGTLKRPVAKVCVLPIAPSP